MKENNPAFVGTAVAPSTTQTPYLTSVDPRVHFTSLLSAGDSVPGATMADGKPWRFAGIPDGLGAYDNEDGTITILVNHELPADAGGKHDTGAPGGAFVDRLVVDKQTLKVVSAQELGQNMYLYNPATKSYEPLPTALARLCSADLPKQSAFYDKTTGLGTKAHILLNGEEVAEGRALGWIASGAEAGNVYELPAFGHFAIENLLASPNTGSRTVVIGNEDATDGQLYVYVGDKQSTGTEIERAGLTNGQLYGIRADFQHEASAGQSLNGTFHLAALGDVSGTDGAGLQKTSEKAAATGWLRPEDGAWDTLNPNRYYFVTTNAIDAPSRLWALDFFDVKHPEYGGTYRALLDGTEGQKMLDNITVSADGTLVLQEDVGNNPRAGKIWSYDPKSDTLHQLAQHDVSRFGNETTPATAPFNQDEESSGVLDVTSLLGDHSGQSVYLLDTQAHYLFGTAGSTDRQQIVEGGQLQLMSVDNDMAKQPNPDKRHDTEGRIDIDHDKIGLGGMRFAANPHDADYSSSSAPIWLAGRHGDTGTLVPSSISALDHRGAPPTLNGDPALVMGHRGTAGLLPEHTLEGYKLAIRLGADFVEPDLVTTKDGYLIARHEPEIGGTTDVKDHPEFTDRFTTKVLDGVSVSGWFAEDFTLAEIKTLYARERIPATRPANTLYNDQYRIPTLDEVIALVKQEEAETGRQIGIIPETKHPTYFAKEGRHLDGSLINVDTSQKLIDTLAATKFTDPSRVIIQSFEVANLIDLQTRIMPAAGVDVPLIQLLNEGGYDIVFNFDPAKAGLGADPGVYAKFGFKLTADSATNGDLYTPAALKAMKAAYAEAIGPYKDDILPTTTLDTPVDGNSDGKAEITRQLTGAVTSLVTDAHAAGLEVVPYTLRNEETFQELNPDGSVSSVFDEYLRLVDLGVDGFFTDFADTGRAAVDAISGDPKYGATWMAGHSEAASASWSSDAGI